MPHALLVFVLSQTVLWPVLLWGSERHCGTQSAFCTMAHATADTTLLLTTVWTPSDIFLRAGVLGSLTLFVGLGLLLLVTWFHQGCIMPMIACTLVTTPTQGQPASIQPCGEWGAWRMLSHWQPALGEFLCLWACLLWHSA